MSYPAMRKPLLSLPLAAIAAAGIGWSTDCLACSSEPYLGSICIMAWPRTNSFGNRTYVAANGAQLTIAQYQALYAVIGTTYGGDARTNFNLPNLSGRTIIGIGRNPDTSATYNPGQYGAGTVLTAANLPTHSHTLNAGTAKPATATATIGTLNASTTLSGLTATTTMNGVTATADGTKLTLKANSGTAGTGTPTGAALSTPSGPANKIYSSTAPDVAMATSSITGSAPVTFSGNPTTQITGNPSTTLSGAPAVTLGGTTDAAGASPSVATLPPYLALSYYIAINGLFPSPD